MKPYLLTLNKSQLNDTIRQAKQKGITLKTVYFKEHLTEIALLNHGVSPKNFHLYDLDYKTKNKLLAFFNKII